MDQNILDEMLARINTLEKENEDIRKEIFEKKKANEKKLNLNKISENLENFEKGIFYHSLKNGLTILSFFMSLF